MKTNDEFYIGWMPNSPGGFSSFLRKYLLLVFLVVIAIGVLLAFKQKEFSTAKFEFGKLTTVEAVYFSKPVPHLLITNNGDKMMIPLVGYGKHGAAGIMKELEEGAKTKLEGKLISLKGTLLYGDGKLLMQVDKNDHPLLSFSNAIAEEIAEEDNGSASFKGEIVDPKCYFGVMKPGEGKPHKDCAIRCISGGIPPVLYIKNEKGERLYILLTNADGNINQLVKDFVGRPVQINGRLKKYADWLILDEKNIAPLAENFSPAAHPLASRCVVSCSPGTD
jgi:hypothetical protein